MHGTVSPIPVAEAIWTFEWLDVVLRMQKRTTIEEKTKEFR